MLALCIRGYFFLMLENKALLPRVKQTLDDITPHLGAATGASSSTSRRSQAWAAGDIMGACRRWEEMLTESPLDLMALKLHHTMTFYTGRSQVMRSVVSRRARRMERQGAGLRLRAGHVRLCAGGMRRL